MVLEEVALFKDFGPVIALIIIMVGGGRWILQKSFDQVELARKESFNQVELARREFTSYVETTSKEHTAAMNKMSENIATMSEVMRQHIKTKEEFIDTINEQRKTINELFEMLKSQIKTNR